MNYVKDSLTLYPYFTTIPASNACGGYYYYYYYYYYYQVFICPSTCVLHIISVCVSNGQIHI